MTMKSNMKKNEMDEVRIISGEYYYRNGVRIPDTGVDRNFFEKLMAFIEVFGSRIPFEQGKPLRVVFDYDPQRDKVYFYRVTDDEQPQPGREYV